MGASVLLAATLLLPQAAVTASLRGGSTPGQAAGRMEGMAEGKRGILTGDAAAIQLQPQGNAVVPGLGTDAHKTCEHWAVDLVENHLRGILVGLKCLQGRGDRNTIMSWRKDITSSAVKADNQLSS